MIDRREKEKSEKMIESDPNSAKGGAVDSDDEPDWMRNFVVKKDDPGQDKKMKKKNKIRVGIGKSSMGRNLASCGVFSNGDVEKDCCTKKGGKSVVNDEAEVGDDEFLLEEYESEEEGAAGDGKPKRKAVGVSLSSSSDEDNEDGSNDEDEEEEEKLKVYFCSRTHSQLSQFIKELRKTVFANEMKAVCLGSRKNFCINEGMEIFHSISKLKLLCSWLIRWYVFQRCSSLETLLVLMNGVWNFKRRKTRRFRKSR